MEKNSFILLEKIDRINFLLKHKTLFLTNN